MARRFLIVLAGLVLLAPTARAEGFGFAALQALIVARQVRSIEGLLPELPASLRYRYALMFASRSLQGASFNDPRVILYGPDARFIVTFNGDPSHRGFHALETMEFDEETKQFRFREIEFPASPSDPSAVTFSEANPDRCQQCHGNPARPVWDTQPLWRGAYGERYRAGLSSKERAGLKAFLATQTSDARYRNLLGVARLTDPETFRSSAQSHYSGTPPEPPNADLSTLLGHLASQSIVSELTADPGFETYKYLLLGMAEGECGGLDEFYPAGRWREIRADFRTYAYATDREKARNGSAQVARLTAGNDSSAPRATARSGATLTMLRFVVEAELHISSRTWSLALEKGTYDIGQARSARDSIRNVLLTELVRRDPAVQEFSDYATSSDGDRYCSYLKRSSRAAFERQTIRAVSARPSAPMMAGPHTAKQSAYRPETLARGADFNAAPGTLEICAGCHQSDVAPKIPFSDATELKREFTSRSTEHGRLIDEIRFRLSPEAGLKRMPLGVDLTDTDRSELEAYFMQLAAKPR